jgi:thymidylate synthase (FAD)
MEEKKEILETIKHEAELKAENCGRKIKCLDKGFVKLVDFFGTDASILQAARVSYGKGTTNKRRDKTLIRYLMRHRHTSPFEMVEFKFHCKMPIFCARQWIRHRTASLNEYSGRYSEMPNECYTPVRDRLQTQDLVNKQGSTEKVVGESMVIQKMMQHEHEQAFKNYDSYLETGLAKELARLNLPLATYTQWYWKMDLHNLFHFLGLRMHPHAQWEMQQFANAIFELIKPIVPMSCEAFEDYRLNARYFSAQEMDLIRKFINGNQPNVDYMIRNNGFSKQEEDEFRKKIE